MISRCISIFLWLCLPVRSDGGIAVCLEWWSWPGLFSAWTSVSAIRKLYRQEDKVFEVDMTGSIKEDIVGRDGVVIYPKGYKYNPMEYVFMRRILVFINGKDEKQIQWYKLSPYPADMRTMLLITDGSYLSVRKKLGTPSVYYANREIIDRMGIKALPSVAVQKGTELEVRQYALEKQIK